MRKVVLAVFALLIPLIVCTAETPLEGVRTYDQNPSHLWNRLYQTLFIRVAPDGTRYGEDRIDPLFWGTTTHLLEAQSHQRALSVLDEFLRKHGEKLISDPLNRAFLQHDLWALFDWSASPYGNQYSRERAELQLRLATIIRRLALTNADLESLPDNYGSAVASNTPTSLPHGLFVRNGDWVNLDVSSGTAPRHFQSFGGRSTFHVLLRLPGGRMSTLAYLKRLATFERPWIYVNSPGASAPSIATNPAMPQFPPGTEWALVRRMHVIDAGGSIRRTSIIESVELRRYVGAPNNGQSDSREALAEQQQTFEFIASRLRKGDLREVQPGERDFYQFQSVDTDPFELSAEALARYRGPDPFRNQHQRDVLRSCSTCHSGRGINSVQSLALITNDRLLSAPTLTESDPSKILSEVVYWNSYQLGLLRGLWDRSAGR